MSSKYTSVHHATVSQVIEHSEILAYLYGSSTNLGISKNSKKGRTLKAFLFVTCPPYMRRVVNQVVYGHVPCRKPCRGFFTPNSTILSYAKCEYAEYAKCDVH